MTISGGKLIVVFLREVYDGQLVVRLKKGNNLPAMDPWVWWHAREKFKGGDGLLETLNEMVGCGKLSHDLAINVLLQFNKVSPRVPLSATKLVDQHQSINCWVGGFDPVCVVSCCHHVCSP